MMLANRPNYDVDLAQLATNGEETVPHRRRFLEKFLPPSIHVSELSDKEVDDIFNRIVNSEFDARTDGTPAEDTADPLPKSRRPNKR